MKRKRLVRRLRETAGAMRGHGWGTVAERVAAESLAPIVDMIADVAMHDDIEPGDLARALVLGNVLGLMHSAGEHTDEIEAEL